MAPPTVEVYSRLVLSRSSRLLSEPPSLVVGVAVAAAAVAAITAMIFPLREISPAASNGVGYLVAVLLVATIWGFRLGLLTSIASAAAFNFFHLPPTGRFTIAEGRHWVALGVFLVAAVVASAVAELARARAREAQGAAGCLRPRRRPGCVHRTKGGSRSGRFEIGLPSDCRRRLRRRRPAARRSSRGPAPAR
jgi:hypothetical protein